MNYKEITKLAGTKKDGRVKLTNVMRKQIIELKGKLSQRAAAKAFGISRSLVILIWFPKKAEHAKELYRIRQKTGRYYNPEKQKEFAKKTRLKKAKLKKAYDLKQDKYINEVIK